MKDSIHYYLAKLNGQIEFPFMKDIPNETTEEHSERIKKTTGVIPIKEKQQ